MIDCDTLWLGNPNTPLPLDTNKLQPLMSARLRHRPQTEEEDASALKLGPGMLFLSNHELC